ncbi:MAG: epoxide hydrolase family protein [Thermomicrobiales bacterium]
MPVSIRPFNIQIPDSDNADLEDRLSRTTLPDPTPGAGDESGIDLPRLGELLAYWRSDYDWRRHESRLNAFPQIIADIDGQQIHAIHVSSSAQLNGEKRLPIILTHGWPYSFIEMTRLVPFLADANSDIQLDIVIPSLPGYGFSEPLRNGPFTGEAVADLWHRLMTEALGYDRYLTYGEDVGARVSDWTAAKYSESVVGLFATHAAFPPESRKNDLSPQEQEWVAWLGTKWKRASAYSNVQATRPDMLAVALRDSPAGLAAWIGEKLIAWSGDRPERFWSDDDLLTTISLYWFSRSIGTSFRAYYDYRFETEFPEITVPVAVAIQHGEAGFPQSYAARSYRDIRSWRELNDGGHFPAWQNSREVAAGILDLARMVI